MKAVEELGKSLFALANLTLVLIIFKGFVNVSEALYLIYGTIFAIITYIIGYKLIKKSEEL